MITTTEAYALANRAIEECYRGNEAGAEYPMPNETVLAGAIRRLAKDILIGCDDIKTAEIGVGEIAFDYLPISEQRGIIKCMIAEDKTNGVENPTTKADYPHLFPPTKVK